MLPLRHSNKTNAISGNTGGTLIRKSERSPKKLPSKGNLLYHGTSANHYSNAPPTYLACPPVSQFRQRPRSLYSHEDRLGPYPNELNAPFKQSLGATSYPKVMLGNMNQVFSTPMPSPPCSPGLDQVLTELRPGPNVVWFCERKREKSKFKSYKGLLICILLLVVGLIAFKALYFAVSRESHVPSRFEIEDEAFQERSLKSSTFEEQEETILQVDLADATANNDSNMEENLAGIPIPTARIKILYSINEDFETTVEVIEG